MAAREQGSKKNCMNHDIIITTYGTLRSDIKLLMNIQFDYVILDESPGHKKPVQQSNKSGMSAECKKPVVHERYAIAE